MTATREEEEIVLKVLHTADWHLGMPFRGFKDNERKLTRARLEAVDRILYLAEHRAVDVVLCAGDLFDGPLPDKLWWEGLVDLFRRRDWKSRPLFLLPGNHDPALPDSVWAAHHPFRQKLPTWVHVIDDDLLEHPLPGNAVLYAIPCKSRSGQADPTEKIPVRASGDDRIRIGLAHGSTFDLGNCRTNFPIDRDAAVKRGLDYLAIGDTHGFRFVPPDRKTPPTIYPGAPEPTRFDEKDPGHVALVFFTRRREARVQAERVAQWAWEESIVRTIAELRALTRRHDLASRVLRLHVDMSVPPAELDEAERLLDTLIGTDAKPGRVGILELHRERLTLDTSDASSFAKLPELLQETARRLQALETDPEKAETARRALVHLSRLAQRVS